MRQVRDDRYFIFVVLGGAKLTSEMTELDGSCQCNLTHGNSTSSDTNTTSAEHTNSRQESDARVLQRAAVSAVLCHIAEFVQQIGTRHAYIGKRNARIVESVQTPITIAMLARPKLS